MNDSGEFSVAVCGLGWWGSKIARNCHNHPSITYLAGCDPDAKTRDKIADEYSIPVFEDLAAAIREHKLDAVFVITPPKTHYEIVMAALKQDIHVVVAKPPTLSLEETEALTAMAAKRNLVLMTDATFCYSPPIRKIKEILDAGKLGKVRHVESIRYGDNLRVQGYTRLENAMKKTCTDVIRDLVMHDLAILTYLFGDGFNVDSVTRAETLFENLCDTAHISLSNPEITAHIALSWIIPERTRKLTICGEDAILVWDDLSPDRRLWVLDKRGSKETVYDIEDKEPLYEMVDHFLEAISSEMEPHTGPSLIRTTMKLLQDIGRT